VRFPELGIQNPYHVFSSNMPLLELAYADDLLFFSRSHVVLQEVVTTLQKHANQYNMQLNMDKTTLLHMNDPNPKPIYFFTPTAPNTVPIKVSTNTKYLGMKINNKGTLQTHLKPKLAVARKDFGLLQRLWSHSDIETQFKLKIFKGIYPAIVLYGLHHDWHLDSTLNMIDSWHCRLLRRVLKVKTTYIDRSKTNEWVYQHAKAEKLSDNIARNQIKYFAHVARHPDNIIHQVCYGPPFIPRSLNATRRKGRPRHPWTENTEALTCKMLLERGSSPINRQHLFTLCQNRPLIRRMTNKRREPSGTQHAGAAVDQRQRVG
jgi:hypothetical protein